jgi:hypothetical protein
MGRRKDGNHYPKKKKKRKKEKIPYRIKWEMKKILSS